MAMNIVHSENIYKIYGDSVTTYTKLPIGTYEINFNKFSGFYLTTHSDLTIAEDKIYGSSSEKVEKVLRGFRAVNRNFGVILSGKKGIGKSLFARQLAIRAQEYNLPLILVSNYIPGIANFISSIEQEVIVLFDEFEKMFGENNDGDPQEEMLSLFDGIDGGKKLFVITCNEIRQLNEYLINRPGRFHYHFILSNPTPDEIRAYLTDKLQPQYYDIVDKVIHFSKIVDLTYDILRAIAFEINMGYSFEDTLADLNISKPGCDVAYTMLITTVDNKRYETHIRLDLDDSDPACTWITLEHGVQLRISINPNQIYWDAINGDLQVNPSDAIYYFDKNTIKEDAVQPYYNMLRQAPTPVTSIKLMAQTTKYNCKYSVY